MSSSTDELRTPIRSESATRSAPVAARTPQTSSSSHRRRHTDAFAAGQRKKLLQSYLHPSLPMERSELLRKPNTLDAAVAVLLAACPCELGRSGFTLGLVFLGRSYRSSSASPTDKPPAKYVKEPSAETSARGCQKRSLDACSTSR